MPAYLPLDFLLPYLRLFVLLRSEIVWNMDSSHWVWYFKDWCNLIKSDLYRFLFQTLRNSTLHRCITQCSCLQVTKWEVELTLRTSLLRFIFCWELLWAQIFSVKWLSWFKWSNERVNNSKNRLIVPTQPWRISDFQTISQVRLEITWCSLKALWISKKSSKLSLV